MVFFILVCVLVLILGVVGSALGKKLVWDMEKLSPFECGFSPKYTPRLPFSMRFLLIAILFLVFDVELVVIFPIIVSLFSAFFFGGVVGIFLILLILLIGLAHEWNQGGLSWSI